MRHLINPFNPNIEIEILSGEKLIVSKYQLSGMSLIIIIVTTLVGKVKKLQEEI